MLSSDEIRLIRHICRNAEPDRDTLAEMLCYCIERSEAANKAEAEPKPCWTPKVGDVVTLTDGITGDHYKVITVRGCEAKLVHDGIVQDGWFDFKSLAPAPADGEPSDREMLDWLAASRSSVLPIDVDQFRVGGAGVGEGVFGTDLRETIRFAMRGDVLAARAEESGPTDREMLDWLDRKRSDLDYIDGEGWDVWSNDASDRLAEEEETARDAIRAAMRRNP